MSPLIGVLWPSVTMACTNGLWPLMFPTGLTEVMLTPPPLEPPRPGLDLAPDLVLGLDLCDVFRLLDLPTLAPFSTSHVRCLVSQRRDPCSSNGQKLRPATTRYREGASMAS